MAEAVGVAEMDTLLCPHQQPGRCPRKTKHSASQGSRGPRWNGVPAAAWGGRRQDASRVAVGAGERAAGQAQAPQVSCGAARPRAWGRTGHAARAKGQWALPSQGERLR